VDQDATYTAEQPAAVDSDPRAVELWERYWSHPAEAEAKERLVCHYLPLVKAELRRLVYHLPKHLDRQELYSEGVVGLLAAIHHFQAKQGVAFSTYARKRIWGAMMDRVRTLDGIPRSSRKAARRISRAIAGFLHKESRQPSESELAGLLGLSIPELHELERQAGLAQTLSLDGAPEPGEDPSAQALSRYLVEPSETQPWEQMAARETQSQLVEGLKTLSDRERAILVLYYHKDMMLKEIAEAMEISESRVSQLHNRALLKLRAFLERSEAAAGHPPALGVDSPKIHEGMGEDLLGEQADA
jgi:RNA polymerase sigma factor for flagellar operon FliA